MWFPSLLALLEVCLPRTQPGQRPPGPPRRKPAAPRPGVEALEARTVPSFLAPVSYPFAGANDVAVGDFNNDGIPDLATTGNNTVSVHLGNGNGTFQPALATTTSSNATLFSLVVGDFNRDGKLDIVAQVYGGGVQTLLGNGDGTFQTTGAFLFPPGMQAVGTTPALGDFNGDGIPDLAIGGYTTTVHKDNWTQFPSYHTAYYAEILLGSGDGSFRAARAITVASFATPAYEVQHLVAGDFNRDGRLDVLTAVDGSGVSLALGNGDGTLKKATAVDPSASGILTVGDFNGDGRLDFIVTGSSTLSAYLGNGNGTFRGPLNFAPRVVANGVNGVAAGDFNHDGKLDLVAMGASTASVLLGNGDGTFQAGQTFAAGPELSHLVVADLNGDGWLDLVAQSYDSATNAWSLVVLLSDGHW
jgi:hypothetical protein